jgi:hypothetical protein
MTIQYKLLAAAAVLLLAFTGGGMAVYKYMASQIEMERSAKAACLHANEGNDAVIRSLQVEVVKAQQSCSGRLHEKDETIKRMQAIDNLTSAPTKTSSPNGSIGDMVSSSGGSNANSSVHSDSILAELNRMFAPLR